MITRRIVSVFGIAFVIPFLGGCFLLSPILSPSLSEKTVETVDTQRDEGFLQFAYGNSRHIIVVDGKTAGTGEDFGFDPSNPGKHRMLAVEPGPHTVEVFEGEKVVFREKVYIGLGVTKTIDLPAGAADR